MAYHWIIAVNGVPMDIRGDAALAIRQGKVRKSVTPTAVVTLHHGPCDARTLSKNGRLHVELSAELLPPLATINA